MFKSKKTVLGNDVFFLKFFVVFPQKSWEMSILFQNRNCFLISAEDQLGYSSSFLLLSIKEEISLLCFLGFFKDFFRIFEFS